MVHQAILAHGESAILPAVFLTLAVYALSVWVLVGSLLKKPGLAVTLSAVAVALLGVAGVTTVLASFELPLEGGLVVTLLFWIFPLLCGIVALARAWRGRSGSK